MAARSAPKRVPDFAAAMMACSREKGVDSAECKSLIAALRRDPDRITQRLFVSTGAEVAQMCLMQYAILRDWNTLVRHLVRELAIDVNHKMTVYEFGERREVEPLAYAIGAGRVQLTRTLEDAGAHLTPAGAAYLRKLRDTPGRTMRQDARDFLEGHLKRHDAAHTEFNWSTVESHDDDDDE